MPPWLNSVVAWLGLATSIAAGIALGRTVVSVLIRRLASRRIAYAKLRSLSPGVQLSFFEQQLGKAPMKERRKDYDQYLWVAREYVAWAIVDAHGIVHAWGITALTRKFRPPLLDHIGGGSAPFPITLNVTTLGQIGEYGRPAWMWGANWFAYGELHNFGRPGWYHSYIVGLADITDLAAWGQLASFLPGAKGPYRFDDTDTGLDLEAWVAARRNVPFNTLVVIASHDVESQLFVDAGDIAPTQAQIGPFPIQSRYDAFLLELDRRS